MAALAFGEVRKAKRLPHKPPAILIMILMPSSSDIFSASKISRKIKRKKTTTKLTGIFFFERETNELRKIIIKITDEEPVREVFEKQAVRTPENKMQTAIIIAITTVPYRSSIEGPRRRTKIILQTRVEAETAPKE